MRYNKLGNTTVEVSEVCLGTMTWGQQNTEADGHEQIEYALSQGVNFIDTAEMYAVPGKAETQGATERIIGSWFKKSGKRKDLVLATKITGRNPSLAYIRPDLNFSKDSLRIALEGSLKRLQTDYIDLYQLHWPERVTNFFGKMEYVHDVNDPWQDNFASVVASLNDFVKEGKIRHYGISNETPWGAMRFKQEAEKQQIASPVSIQNPYSLLNRSYEVGLAEISIREAMGLLAYSPLAFGVLSGKYLSQVPNNSRLALFPQFSRYSNSLALAATAKYKVLADSLNVSLTTLSLAFTMQQDFVTAIIGATSMDQLKENIDAHRFIITPEIFKELDKIHREIPNPAP
jgi:aryl-alcohol dehydrogenase-like predicted oxidoreductase